jgi:DNA-binding NarL/FixJ family response regulator
MIVDDEAPVTMSLRDLFLVQADFRIVTHTSARAALSAAGTLAVDLVISDYRMPEMDGATFLSRFKEIPAARDPGPDGGSSGQRKGNPCY